MAGIVAEQYPNAARCRFIPTAVVDRGLDPRNRVAAAGRVNSVVAIWTLSRGNELVDHDLV